MKKTIIGILSAIILLLGGNYAIDNLGGSNDTLPLIRTQCHTGTTTPTYLTNGTGTTTCSVYIENSETVSLNFLLNASSTSSVLETQNFISFDDGSNRNWFLLANKTTSTDTNTYYEATNQYTAVAAGDNEINITLTDLNAKWLKIQYGVIGANGSVYLEVIK